MYKSFTYLVKFIPKYVILFDAIVSGIIFLISFLDCSLLFGLFIVYRNTTDFCVLILYLATLLNLFTSTNSYSVDFLNSLYVRSCYL